MYFFSFRSTGGSVDLSMIDSNQSKDEINNSLQVFLVERNASEYIDVVPKYWLGLGKPQPNVHLYFSIVFLTICIPGNLSQLLVMLAYTRYIVCLEILWTNVYQLNFLKFLYTIKIFFFILDITKPIFVLQKAKITYRIKSFITELTYSRLYSASYHIPNGVSNTSRSTYLRCCR